MPNPERITSAAVVVNEHVYLGRHHGEAYDLAKDLGEIIEDDGDCFECQDKNGIIHRFDDIANFFMTSSGRVITRTEAMEQFKIWASEDVKMEEGA